MVKKGTLTGIRREVKRGRVRRVKKALERTRTDIEQGKPVKKGVTVIEYRKRGDRTAEEGKRRTMK